jgi:hypothetical protein
MKVYGGVDVWIHIFFTSALAEDIHIRFAKILISGYCETGGKLCSQLHKEITTACAC